MAIAANTKNRVTALLTLLNEDAVACEAVASAAVRRCSPATRDVILALVPLAKPGVPHGTTDATAASNVAAVIADLEAND